MATVTPLVRAAIQYMRSDFPLVVQLGNDEAWDTWIFPLELMTTDGTVENSQMVAVVVSQDGAWAPPNGHNSMEFPRLLVNIWADPTRNADNSVQRDDAQDKIIAVKKSLDALLHMSERRTSYWGDLRVIGCTRLGEVEFYPVREGNGSVMGQIFYGVSLG